MTITIVEVLNRSAQGRTQPYLCRGDDGNLYFVKGRSATRAGLMAEWLCARLGERFGLPIPPYTIANVPEELLETDDSGFLSDLGAGPVFASQLILASELTAEQRVHIDPQLRRDVLIFDWWVRNDDRSLTGRGGNPNLLWNPADDGSLVVIDHNLAFDPKFSTRAFVETHVFADEIPHLFSDFVARQDYERRLADALHIWDESCAMLPRSWRFIDAEMTSPADVSLEVLFESLQRFERESFWSLEP